MSSSIPKTTNQNPPATFKTPTARTKKQETWNSTKTGLAAAGVFSSIVSLGYLTYRQFSPNIPINSYKPIISTPTPETGTTGKVIAFFGSAFVTVALIYGLTKVLANNTNANTEQNASNGKPGTPKQGVKKSGQNTSSGTHGDTKQEKKLTALISIKKTTKHEETKLEIKPIDSALDKTAVSYLQYLDAMSELNELNTSEYDKINQIITFLTSSHEDISNNHKNNLLRSVKNILTFNQSNNADYGQALENIFYLCLEAKQDNLAYNIVFFCLDIKKEENQQLIPYIKRILETAKTHDFTNVLQKNQTVENFLNQPADHSSSTKGTVNTNETLPPKITLEKAPWESLDEIVKLFQKGTHLKDSTYDKIDEIIHYVDTTVTKIDKNSSYDHKKLVKSLTDFVIELMQRKRGGKNYTRIAQIVVSTYDSLLKIDTASALRMASVCANKNEEPKDPEKVLFNACQNIVKKTRENDELMIPFAILCAEKSSNSEKCKEIAEEIWNQIQDYPKKQLKFLIGCSKISNDFCQDKLKECAIEMNLKSPLREDLRNSCIKNLFHDNSMLPREGNKDIIIACGYILQQHVTSQHFLNIEKTVKRFLEKDNYSYFRNEYKELYGEFPNKQLLIPDREELFNDIEFLFFHHFLSGNIENVRSLLAECQKYPNDPELTSFFDEKITFLENNEEWANLALELKPLIENKVSEEFLLES